MGTALGEARGRDPHPSPRMPGVQAFLLRPTSSKPLMGQASQVGAYVLGGCVEAVPMKGAWVRLGTRGGHLVSGSSTKSLVVALWLGRDRSPALQ